MGVVIISFVAGCAAGAFFTVWVVVALSAAGLMAALGAGLSGALAWPETLSTLILPMFALQGGFLVAVFGRGAKENWRPQDDRSEAGADAEKLGTASRLSVRDVSGAPHRKPH